MTEIKSKLIVVFFFMAMTLCVSLAVIYSHVPELDSVTGCQKSNQNRQATYILFDQSDEFERGDLERAKNYISQILDSLETDEKLVAIELSPQTPYEPTVLFEMCSPKKRSEWSQLFDNIKDLEKQSIAFTTEFNQKTEGALKRKELLISPILEAISYISSRNDFALSTNRDVHIFSDFLQNFENLNFYKGIPSHLVVTEKSIKINRIKLNETSMHLIIVARRNLWGSRSDVKDFWTVWLKKREAIVFWHL